MSPLNLLWNPYQAQLIPEPCRMCNFIVGGIYNSTILGMLHILVRKQPNSNQNSDKNSCLCWSHIIVIIFAEVNPFWHEINSSILYVVGIVLSPIYFKFYLCMQQHKSKNSIKMQRRFRMIIIWLAGIMSSNSR